MPAVGPGITSLTVPLRVGLKPATSLPVATSKAITLPRLVAAPPTGVTVVKVPPTTMVLPTWAMAFTAPLLTAGVVPGTAETMRSWLTGAADWAGAATAARASDTTRVTTRAAAVRARPEGPRWERWDEAGMTSGMVGSGWAVPTPCGHALIMSGNPPGVAREALNDRDVARTG